MTYSKNTIVSDLSITTFPTYMLIKNTGEIIFSGSIDEFDELNRILSKY